MKYLQGSSASAPGCGGRQGFARASWLVPPEKKIFMPNFAFFPAKSYLPAWPPWAASHQACRT